jgi:beta-lactamase superfamily II metal-dependent hydrolase
MGDAEEVSEGEILQKQLDIKADVIKVGHHGSRSSSTKAFLEKVNPKYAVISCEKGNDYGHPHKVTIDKLNAKNINVFRTDLEGTIIATSDGNEITFNTKPVDKTADIPGNPKKN